MFQNHSRKHKLNELFFSTWSPEMAYVLGFWYADGYMRHEKSYRISFSSNDLEILEKIRTVVGSDCPIYKIKTDDAYSIVFHSKLLYETLESLGGMRRKSKFIRFPEIPKEYIRDFIRGYFDGDGSVHFVQYIRTKDKRLTIELRTNFTSGSRKFLEDLMEMLHQEIDLPMKQICAFNAGRSLKLGYGMRDSDALLRYMYYKNFPIALERKAVFVSKIPDYELHAMRH